MGLQREPQFQTLKELFKIYQTNEVIMKLPFFLKKRLNWNKSKP